MTEGDLIDRARAGDPAAARSLYNRYAPRVFAVVRRIAGDDDLAEDYAQEAWVRAFRALPGFRGDARFSTWMHRIAVNTALQGDRRVRRHESRRTPFPEVIPVKPRIEGRDPLLAARLEEALDRLPDGMRRVMVLHDVEGHTHQEIGEMLGINEGTSKSQLFKARARMRDLLNETMNEVDADAAPREGGMEA